MHAKPLTNSQRDLQSQIEAEQVKSIYQQYPTLVFGGLAGSGLMAFFMWDQVAHATIFWWLGVFFTSSVGAVLALLWYNKTGEAHDNRSKWKILLYFTLIPLTTTWGLIGVLFYIDGVLEYQLLILVWLWALASMATSAMVAYKPMFYASLFPFLGPISVRLAVEMEPLHIGLAVSTVVYGGMQAFLYGNNHAVFLNAVRLRFENIDLVSKLTLQKEEAERANLAKSRFLAIASHDLRQPIHAQGLFVAALRQRINDGGENSQILNELDGSIQAMGGLFNALLDISNLDAGVVQPRITDFPIQTVLDKLVRDYEGQATEKNLLFDVAPSSFVIRSDQTLLTRILLNLVSNAVCYTASGEISVNCHEKGNELQITVCDTGIGIPLEQQKEIFREYCQLHNPERDRTKGLGLGLAIVDRLIKLLGHGFDLKSKVGFGSEFSITIPVGVLSDSNVDAEPSANPVNYNLKGARILVIDDELAIRKGMQKLLESWGCHTVLASSLEEGLAQLQSSKNTLDVIIADYWLQNGESGVEAINQVRSVMNENTPAILITGDTSPEGLQQAHASGHLILHKPVPAEDLHAIIGYLISED